MFPFSGKVQSVQQIVSMHLYVFIPLRAAVKILSSLSTSRAWACQSQQKRSDLWSCWPGSGSQRDGHVEDWAGSGSSSGSPYCPLQCLIQRWVSRRKVVSCHQLLQSQLQGQCENIHPGPLVVLGECSQARGGLLAIVCFCKVSESFIIWKWEWPSLSHGPHTSIKVSHVIRKVLNKIKACVSNIIPDYYSELQWMTRRPSTDLV